MLAQVIQTAIRPTERRHIREMTFTPETAREWLTNYAYKLQRLLNLAHASYLTRTMIEGSFDDDEPIRCVAVKSEWEDDGIFYLVDGQHRLEAIIRSGIPQYLIVITTIVESYSDVATIYGRIDRGRQRSIGDVMRATSDFELYGLSASIANECASAATIIEGRFSNAALYGMIYESRSTDARRNMAIKYAIPAIRYIKAIDSADWRTKRAFSRRVVMAVAIATYDGPDSESRADDFWKIAALDDGLGRDDPRRQLLRFLYQMTGQHNIKQRNMALRGVVHCWNAYYEGRTIHAARPLLTGPINILGTRFAAEPTE